MAGLAQKDAACRGLGHMAWRPAPPDALRARRASPPPPPAAPQRAPARAQHEAGAGERGVGVQQVAKHGVEDRHVEGALRQSGRPGDAPAQPRVRHAPCAMRRPCEGCRTAGCVALRPTYRLHCPSGCPSPACLVARQVRHVAQPRTHAGVVAQAARLPRTPLQRRQHGGAHIHRQHVAHAARLQGGTGAVTEGSTQTNNAVVCRAWS